jgi:two-component system, sporulation sensor kinase E
MLSLRAKVAVVCFVLPVLAIFIVSALETGRATRLMVQDLGTSGSLLVAQTFEQMRDVLQRNPGDAAVALKNDPALQALFRSSRAFGKGVSYIRLSDAAGRSIISAPEDAAPPPGTLPFEELGRGLQRWWPLAPVWLLSRGAVYEQDKPVEINGRPFAVIAVGLSTDLIAEEIHRSLIDIFKIAGFAIVLSIMAALVLGKLLLHPVMAITSGVEKLAVGNDEVSLAITAHDEFGTLADKFNQLSQRIRTDRRQWETERDTFFNVFRSITDAVLLLDRKGAILFANPEALGRLGLPAGGLADGKSLSLLLGKHHPLSKMIATAYSMGGDVHDVAIEFREGGGTVHFLVSISSLGHGPEPPGLLVIVRDLDPVQKLEGVINHSGRLARLAALISGVAHQIRTPLNAMNLQLELLSQDAEAGVPVRPRLEAMRGEVGRLDQVMNALLRFMRPEELKLAETSINDLLKDIGVYAEHNGLQVRYQLDPNCPPLMIDRSLVGEALRNIVTNAAEAMRSGGTITVTSAVNGDEWIELSVEDEGPGIATEHLTQIFNLYFTTKEGGNGLGLPLAMRAIDLHQGTLDIKSKVGEGTIVLIRLPLAGVQPTGVRLWTSEREHEHA